jgi:hypothetical protein
MPFARTQQSCLDNFFILAIPDYTHSQNHIFFCLRRLERGESLFAVFDLKPALRTDLPPKDVTSVPQLPHNWELALAIGYEDTRHPTKLTSLRTMAHALKLED